MEDWKKNTYIGGAIIGVAVGVAAAYMMIRKAESENDTVKLDAKNGLAIGKSVISIIRQLG